MVEEVNTDSDELGQETSPEDAKEQENTDVSSEERDDEVNSGDEEPSIDPDFVTLPDGSTSGTQEKDLSLDKFTEGEL